MLLLLLLFSEFDERLVFEVLFAKIFSLLFVDGVVLAVEGELIIGCADGEPVSITCTKFDGKTPTLPFSLPFHQPVELIQGLQGM